MMMMTTENKPMTPAGHPSAFGRGRRGPQFLLAVALIVLMAIPVQAQTGTSDLIQRYLPEYAPTASTAAPAATDEANAIVSEGPLTLEQAIAVAFANSLTLEMARLDVEEATLQLKQTEATHLMTPSPTALIEARRNVDIAQQQLTLAEFDLKLEVEEHFYAVLRTSNLAAVAEEALDLSRRQLNIAEQRLESGAETRADVLTAVGDVAEAEATFAQAHGGHELALLNFRRTLGVGYDTTVTPAANDFHVVEHPVDLERDLTFAITHRIEIHQLLTALESIEKQIELADNDYTPEIALQGARLGLAKINNQLQQAVTGIQLEIRHAHLTMADTARRLPALEKRVEAAEENLRVVTQLYELDMAPLVQVLGTQTALAKAKADYIHAIFDYNLAKARYDRAVARPLEGGSSR